jgi:hypothetical protein
VTPSESSRSIVRSVGSRVARLACSWIIGCLAAATASAQSSGPTISYEARGFVATVPNDTTYSLANNLQLEVDTCWPHNYGYRPIRVVFKSAQPTTVEHRIKIRVHVAAWETPNLEVDQSFDIPLGATEAETILRCPQFQAECSYWWDVWVDGVRDRELCFDEAGSATLHSTAVTNATGPATKVLLVGPKAESNRSRGAGSGLFEDYALAIAELPSRWIDYSAFDVVAISPLDLKTLSRTRPEAITALRRWIRAGGQLWVHPLGSDWKRLGEVERLLELAPSSEIASSADDTNDDTNDDAINSANRWKPIELRAGSRGRSVSVHHIPTGKDQVVSDPARIERLRLSPEYIVSDEDPPESESTAETPDPPKWDDTADWYVERPLGLGRVRAFRPEWDPDGFRISWMMLASESFNPGSPAPRSRTPLTATFETTRNWQSRYGLSPDLANEDFADLLVPGVGLAPVNEFRVLITLFVLGIGPLSYWLLMRANRLHLMLLTVPIIAAGLTSALFAYALVSDGLSTTVRVRSFTSLDQTTGEAATWARLSYYSGLAPSNGLVLPDDLTFYPIVSGWNETSDSATPGVTRRLAWSADKQLLNGGWLRSRVPTQYLSVRARKSPYRLRLESHDGQFTATNELATRIVSVAAVDDKNNVYSGESIDDGATVRLNPSTHADVLKQLRQRLLENQPELPPALADEQNSISPAERRDRRRMFQQRYDLNYGSERLSENLLSGAISNLGENNADCTLNLPPNSYVTITETGPEVELGIEGANEEASFHVLVGHW